MSAIAMRSLAVVTTSQASFTPAGSRGDGVSCSNKFACTEMDTRYEIGARPPFFIALTCQTAFCLVEPLT